MVYTEVLSGVWIGNIDMMYNKQFLTDNQIEVIINCTIEFKFPELNIQKYRIPISDNINDAVNIIKNNKNKILELIDQVISESNVLICCYDGQLISPFLISIYLIHYGDISYEQVKQILSSKNNQLSMDVDSSLLLI